MPARYSLAPRPVRPNSRAARVPLRQAPARSAAATSSIASRETSVTAIQRQKPCTVPSKRRAWTGTPASRERGGVGLCLVAQRVAVGGQHVGGREAGEVGRAQRRGVGMEAVGAVEVQPPVALHGRGGEPVALAELAVGGRVDARVADGVDQRLHPQLDLAEQAPGGHGGEVAARAVARHREPRGVAAELARMLGQPAQRAERVVERGGERVLGGEAVVDGDHDRARGVGQRAADGVEGVDVADHPAAAVQVGDHRQRAVRRRHGPERAGRDDAAPEGSSRSRTSATSSPGPENLSVSATWPARACSTGTSWAAGPRSASRPSRISATRGSSGGEGALRSRAARGYGSSRDRGPGCGATPTPRAAPTGRRGRRPRG